MNKFFSLKIALVSFLSLSTLSYALNPDNIGQTLQIYTRLHSFQGTPTWTLIVRDVDNNQTIPYMFEIRKGTNFWLNFTFGKNYLITLSKVQISSYKSCCNQFKKYVINNFCNLESHGRIIRGESLSITVSGDLSPNPNTYSCQITRFPIPSFTIVGPASST